MSLAFVIVNRSLLVIFSGLKIFSIFLRQLLWDTESLLMSLSVILQHSEPYSSTDSTQLLNYSCFVDIENAVDLQMLPNLINADFAFAILILMSFSAQTSIVTRIPR